MARMSVDDSVGRDPRITLLAQLVGWSKRETVGCLVIDVWPICYDQETAEITTGLIDTAAARPGFADAMVEAELADRVRGGRKVRIRGAQERIRYLADSRESGRVGGLKSAESRRKGSRVVRSDPQGSRNPPDPVPDSAPDPVPPPAPDMAMAPAPFANRGVDLSGPEPEWWGNPSPSAPPPKVPTTKAARVTRQKAAIPGTRRKSFACAMPADWTPGPFAVPAGVDVQRELERFRNHATASGRRLVDWNAGWRNWLLKAEEYAQARPKQQMSAFAYTMAVANGEIP